MNIEGLAYFDVLINNTQIEGARNLFEEVMIQSGIGLPAPLARITFADLDGVLSGNFALVDGTILTLKFGSSSDEFKEVEFFVFSKDSYAQDGTIKQQVFCILNKANYLFESSFDKKRGSSIDAIKDIFDKASIEYEASVSTDDTQLWVNCGKTKQDYIKHLTSHAYVDDKSCILTVLDFDKAYTKDLFKIFDTEPEIQFTYQVSSGDEDSINLQECKTTSRSGFLNSSSNYGHYFQQHSLNGDTLEFDSIDPVIPNGGSLPINTDIKGNITNSSHSMGSYYDSGSGDMPGANLHENYFRAAYQNLRYYSLFSEGLYALSTYFLDPPLLTLYDIHHGEVRGTTAELDDIHSGLYILTGKTLILRGMKYAERYDFLRYFLTEEGNTSVVAGSEPEVSNSSDSALAQSQGTAVSAPTSIVAEGYTTDTVVNETPISSTGNKLPSKEPTVLDKATIYKEQANSNINSNKDSINSTLANATGTVQSLFDETVEGFDKTLSSLESEFAEQSKNLGSDALSTKYGKSYDKLNALLTEFQSATEKYDACKMLNSLESETLALVLPEIPTLINLVNDRIGKINSKLETMYDSIDNLVAKGEISEESLDVDKLSVECGSSKNSLLENAGLEDAIKPACLDSRDVDRLNAPILGLLKLEQDLNSKLEDLICASGE